MTSLFVPNTTILLPILFPSTFQVGGPTNLTPTTKEYKFYLTSHFAAHLSKIHIEKPILMCVLCIQNSEQDFTTGN